MSTLAGMTLVFSISRDGEVETLGSAESKCAGAIPAPDFFQRIMGVAGLWILVSYPRSLGSIPNTSTISNCYTV